MKKALTPEQIVKRRKRMATAKRRERRDAERNLLLRPKWQVNAAQIKDVEEAVAAQLVLIRELQADLRGVRDRLAAVENHVLPPVEDPPGPI